MQRPRSPAAGVMTTMVMATRQNERFYCERRARAVLPMKSQINTARPDGMFKDLEKGKGAPGPKVAGQLSAATRYLLLRSNSGTSVFLLQSAETLVGITNRLSTGVFC